MANMSYCRFENTCFDLVDCVVALDAIQGGDEVSRIEWRYAKRMREWCEKFIENIDELDESNINFED